MRVYNTINEKKCVSIKHKLKMFNNFIQLADYEILITKATLNSK